MSPFLPLARGQLASVNAVQTEAELAAVRRSVARGAPFGEDRWSQQIAEQLGLEASLRPRCRPGVKSKNRMSPFVLSNCRESSIANASHLS